MKSNPNKHTHEIAITPEGWLYIVILAFISVGAVLRNVNLLILMSGMMIAPLIINWRLAVLRARTLSAKRSLPYRVHAKSVTGVQWLCFNESPLSAWGLEVVDSMTVETQAPLDPGVRSSEAGVVHGGQDRRLIGEIEREPESRSDRFLMRLWRALKEAAGLKLEPKAAFNLRLALSSIGGNQQEVITGRVYFSERGMYRFGPAQMVTRFPFGLVSLALNLEKTELLFVAPQIGRLTPVWDRRVSSILAGAEALLKRRGLAGDDFYALRRWRSGDSRKLIHWRSSAKFGYPIVKQFEQPDNRDFALLLDLWAPSGDVGGAADSEDHRSPAEQACEVCLSFATTLILNIGSAVKGRIGLAICGQQTVWLQSRSQRELIESTMRCLAIARSSPAPQIAGSLIQLADSVSANTPLIVVSSRPPIDLLATDANTESIELKALRNLWPLVDWLDVQSTEFRELFELEEVDQDLQTLATKWSEHVAD